MHDILIIDRQSYIDLKGQKYPLQMEFNSFIAAKAMAYGSSISGRKASFSYYTGHHVLIPLIISIKENLYFLLTRSLKADDVILINYALLWHYHRLDDQRTKLYFDSGITIDIKVNYRIIKRQIKLLRDYLLAYRQFIFKEGQFIE